MDIYIDESGSIHPTNDRLNRYFIIGMVLPQEKKRLLRRYKLFVRKNLEELKRIDKDNRMFDKQGKFKELKGACLNRKMKQEFLSFFCQENLFKVGYIILDNNKLQTKFISNKARTFNYLLKLFFANAMQRRYITDGNLLLNIDERNVKTNSRFSLEDYLNQELVLNLDLLQKVEARYFDSSRNNLIQVADVFSNILYSNIVTHGAYQNELNKMFKNGYLLPLFRFPK